MDYRLLFNKQAILAKIKEEINSFYKQKQIIIPKELVGISINQNEIAIAHVIANSIKDIEVTSYEHAYLNSDSLKRDFLNDYVMENRLSGLPASYVLPLNTYDLSMIEEPSDAKAVNYKLELQNAVAEFINYPAEEAVIGAFSLPLKRISDNKKVMYAASIPAKIIPNIEEMVNGAGLTLQYLDIQELCLRNLAFLHPQNVNGSLFVYMHKDGAQIVILKQDTIFAARQIDVPLGQLITKEVGNKNIEYNEEELLDTLALDLQRSIDFCSNIFRESPAKLAILAPSIVNINKVNEYLKQHFSLPVLKMNLAELMQFRQNNTDEKQEKCLLAIAACLRYLPEQGANGTEH